MKTFRRAQRVECIVVSGPEPVGAAGAAALAVQYGLNLAGHNGSVPFGDPSSPAMRFSGYIDSPQLLIGAGTYGANTTPTPAGLHGALPDTQTPPGLPGALQSMFPAGPQ